MPFNQLILPLLGGYILVTYTNCAVYWSSRQSKEQLLFASAFVGALLAFAARAIALVASECAAGVYLYSLVHSFLNYDGIGTAVLALALSVSLRWWINKGWPMSEAGFWLYGKDTLNQFESLLFLSFSGVAPANEAVFRSLPVELLRRLLAAIPYVGVRMRKKIDNEERWRVISSVDEASGKVSPIPLLLTMKDRKVYVGFLEKMPSLAFGSMAYVNIVVLRSGFRDKDDLHVTFTDDYTAVFETESAKEIGMPSWKVLPVCDIVSASLFHVDVYELFQGQRSALPSTPYQARQASSKRGLATHRNTSDRF